MSHPLYDLLKDLVRQAVADGVKEAREICYRDGYDAGVAAGKAEAEVDYQKALDVATRLARAERPVFVGSSISDLYSVMSDMTSALYASDLDSNCLSSIAAVLASSDADTDETDAIESIVDKAVAEIRIDVLDSLRNEIDERLRR